MGDKNPKNIAKQQKTKQKKNEKKIITPLT